MCLPRSLRRCWTLLKPGALGFALTGGTNAAEIVVDTDIDYSILNMIVGIVPSNLVRPFLEADTLQIMFLAVLIGISVGMIGEYSSVLGELFEACNSLFLTMTTLIAGLMPVAVFCTMALVLVDIGAQSLLAVLGYLGEILLTVMLMIGFYGLLVLVMARLDPITFFRKVRTGMINSFTLSSSSATIPTNLKICTDELGISPKLCNFSIPLGATVNMDGTCIYLATCAMFLARAYGVTVTGSMLVSMLMTIVLLSLGAPGVPGSGTICLGIVLQQIGVPIEALGLIMAITPILDRACTMNNVTGDMAGTLIVARSEGLMDVERYRKMRS